MRIRGMGVTASAYYRDKLAMRTGAQESGFLVARLLRVLNYDELRATWPTSPRHGSSSRAPRPLRRHPQILEPSSSGEPSTNSATGNPASSSNNSSPATSTTSIPSSRKAKSSSPSPTSTAARPCR